LRFKPKGKETLALGSASVLLSKLTELDRVSSQALAQPTRRGSKKENTAMFKLHLDSGIVDIPKDPSLMYNLRQANLRLEPYAIAVEEIEAIARA